MTRKTIVNMSIDTDIICKAQELYPRQISYLCEQFLCNLAGMEQVVQERKVKNAGVEAIKINVEEVKKYKAKCQSLDELNERAKNDWGGLSKEDQRQWQTNKKKFMQIHLARSL